MVKDDAIFMGHMLEYALLVAETIEGYAEEDLVRSRDLLHLVVYRLHVIGEAARNVSVETQRLHPEMPWSEVIALRNRLIHGYFDINASVVFKIASGELPGLITVLKAVVPSEYQAE